MSCHTCVNNKKTLTREGLILMFAMPIFPFRLLRFLKEEELIIVESHGPSGMF